jgi:glycosyltransferase involved in cell wall biosynthesis
VPIVGDGELHDELTQQVSRLGIERMVKFLGFRDDLDALYPAFDIYCHSSLELAAEAFPLAILRALSAGLPIVCTDVGGIRNMVEDGVSGYLRPPDQPEPLGKALLDVIQLPALRESMGQASRSLFERKFHAATMANTVAKIYETILSRNYHG